MSTVIKVENLSKQYRLGGIGTGTLSHDVNRWWHRMRGKEDPYLKIGEVNDRTEKGSSDYVWALRDINFEVQQGDVVGIIGKNGAGKSTLLKILSRTTLPTTGSVKARGRIASLLEVGTGFHPELTGRENIFLNGAIMGMRKAEIQTKFDEIVDFAGVEKYIDTPVKRYSSGMYVRLAFAVAAYLDPDILIVDEVLAVGDAEFQKKALGKMKDVSHGQGRTVLFVSHNMGAIRQLCKTGILLTNGEIQMVSSIEQTIKTYFNQSDTIERRPSISDYRTYNTAGSPVLIEDVFVKGSGDTIPTLSISECPTLIMRVRVNKRIEGANITLSVLNSEGIKVGVAFSWDNDFYLTADVGVYEVKFTLMSCQLTPDFYTLAVGINQSTQTVAWDGINMYPIFKIENQNDVVHFAHRLWGITHLGRNKWELNSL